MTKKEIQKRLIRNGEPLGLGDFEWDEKSITLATSADNVTIQFDNIHSATINAGSSAVIDVSSSAVINASYSAVINASSSAVINAGYSAVINAGSSAVINVGNSAVINAGDYAVIDVGSSAVINAGYSAVINAGSSAVINVGNSAVINVGSSASITAGKESVIVNRNVFEVITLTSKCDLQICPKDIPGHVIDGVYSVTGKPAIIADGILSEIIKTKKINDLTVHTVINHGEKKETFLVQKGGLYSHGATIEQAKTGLIYKLSDRDTSKYKNLSRDSVVDKETAIQAYMTITGACETGTKYFVDRLEKVPEKITISEIIDLTKGQYNNDVFAKFFD